MHQNHPNIIPSHAASTPDVIAPGMRQKFRPGSGVMNWLSAIFVIVAILALILVVLFVR